MDPKFVAYLLIAAIVAVIGTAISFRLEGDRTGAGENFLLAAVPLGVAVIWPVAAAFATFVAAAWLVGAAIRAFHFRKEWKVDRQADVADLTALKEILVGLDAWVFGSSVKALPGGFSTRRGDWPHDIDLVGVVGRAAFAAWKAAAYAGGVVDSYNAAHPTRSSRLAAAEEVLWVKYPEHLDIDVFLFEQEYIDGSGSVPAWDDRFRGEVLSARKRLSTLGVAWAIPSALLYKAKPY